MITALELGFNSGMQKQSNAFVDKLRSTVLNRLKVPALSDAQSSLLGANIGSGAIGTYGALREPGEGETRLGNCAKGVVGGTLLGAAGGFTGNVTRRLLNR